MDPARAEYEKVVRARDFDNTIRQHTTLRLERQTGKTITYTTRYICPVRGCVVGSNCKPGEDGKHWKRKDSYDNPHSNERYDVKKVIIINKYDDYLDDYNLVATMEATSKAEFDDILAKTLADAADISMHSVRSIYQPDPDVDMVDSSVRAFSIGESRADGISNTPFGRPAGETGDSADHPTTTPGGQEGTNGNKSTTGDGHDQDGSAAADGDVSDTKESEENGQNKHDCEGETAAVMVKTLSVLSRKLLQMLKAARPMRKAMPIAIPRVNKC